MESHNIRVGSRESRLAVAQSELVMERIRAAHPELVLELVTMKTTGDLILDRPLDRVGGKGLFVKELDAALLGGRIDLSVHSLKDLPMEPPDALPVAAYSRREDPRDVLALPAGVDALDPGKPIGCSSARRACFLRRLYPGMRVESVRGNVLTRLQKLDGGQYAALVLARAGLLRLGLGGRVSRIFSVDEMLPAAGQGILAVQARAGEDTSYLDCVDDPDARRAALAERAFVRALGGGCSAPTAAHARISAGRIRLRGFYLDERTGEERIDELCGSAEEAERLGAELARRLGGEG